MSEKVYLVRVNRKAVDAVIASSAEEALNICKQYTDEILEDGVVETTYSVPRVLKSLNKLPSKMDPEFALLNMKETTIEEFLNGKETVSS